jgi:hypothetical protein
MKAVSTEQRFIFLGLSKGLLREPLPPRVFVCHDRSQVESAMRYVSKRVTWVSFNRTFTDILLEQALDLRVHRPRSHLLTLAPPRAESIPVLLGLFNPVYGLVDGFRWLPNEELIGVIMRQDADRFVGGSVDVKARALTLLRGNLETVVAPFSTFPESGDGTKPDFTRLGFTDHGRTVMLGEYEASPDAILYELDPDYRRKLNKQRRQNEKSFGASLVRLRKQRRLTRGDFGPISSKEIARIERNEIHKPHTKTLEIIAERLGVRREEIGTY